MRAHVSVLTREALLREIDSGRLVIEPFSHEQIGPASIDLSLGDEIRVMDPGPEPIPVRDDTDFRDVTGEILADHLGAQRLDAIFPGHHIDARSYKGLI